MKPDQHKKKRSAQYKKKHGIQNDKTGKLAKGKASEHRGEKVENSSTTSSTSNVHDTASHASRNEAKHIGSKQNVAVDDEKEITPSFSRRKIESNWDRYEGLPDDDEDETITSRGVEFNRLLSETGRAEAQFRFKDEQSWEGDETMVSEAGSKLLSVDVDALARHVKAIPLPERLGIMRCLFEADLLKKLDREAEESASSIKGGHPLKTSSSPVSSSRTVLSDADAVTSQLAVEETTQKLHQTKELKESLKSSLPTTSDAINSSKVKGCEGTCDLAGKDTRTSTRRLDSMPSQVTKDVITLEDDEGDVEEDEELDFLLSLENPVQVKGQSVVTSDAVEDERKADTTTTQETSGSAVLQTACQHTAVHDGTDDLEDWLDDMLDD